MVLKGNTQFLVLFTFFYMFLMRLSGNCFWFIAEVKYMNYTSEENRNIFFDASIPNLENQLETSGIFP